VCVCGACSRLELRWVLVDNKPVPLRLALEKAAAAGLNPPGGAGAAQATRTAERAARAVAVAEEGAPASGGPLGVGLAAVSVVLGQIEDFHTLWQPARAAEASFAAGGLGGCKPGELPAAPAADAAETAEAAPLSAAPAQSFAVGLAFHACGAASDHAQLQVKTSTSTSTSTSRAAARPAFLAVRNQRGNPRPPSANRSFLACPSHARVPACPRLGSACARGRLT